MKGNSEFKSVLGRKLIFYIMLFSISIIVIGTSFQLYLDYKKDRENLDYIVSQMKTSQLPSVIRSLWVADQELIQIKLYEMLSLPYIEYLEIRNDGEVITSAGNKFSKNVVTKTYPLLYSFRDQEIKLGELYLEASLVEIYQRLVNRILNDLLVLGSFILLGAAFSFLTFHFLIGRNLKILADYTSKLDFDTLDIPLELVRRTKGRGQPDEIEMIASSLNEMRLGLLEEISKLKKAELIIAKGKAQFEAIFNSITDALIFVDLERRVIRTNPAFTKIFGYRHEDLIGKTTECLYADQNDYKIQGKERYSKDALNLNPVYEVDYQRNDGSVFVGETLAVKINDESGEIIGYLGIIRDITEKKRAQEEKNKLEANLRQAYKMEALGTMAGGIAHDFNNILTIIMGNADLALDDISVDHPSRNSLEQIAGAADRAKKLVRQILSFSRRQKQNAHPLQLQMVIKETLELLRSTTPATVSIVEKIDSDCPAIMADPTQFHQLLMNLFNNAVFAIDEKGMIEVGLDEVKLRGQDFLPDEKREPGPYVRLSVRDSGTGMDRKTMERIFDPFFTTKDPGKGTGMGLSVVHGVVESAGGIIRVESKPGNGTTFKIYFPVVECRGIIASEESVKAMPSGTERVLFVDDEECLVVMGRRILERLGYTVIAETSSIEALESFRAAPEDFDILITDQTMPYMSGTELIAEVLKIRADLPIVLCTGYSSKVSAENAENMGIDVLIVKPYEKKILANAIRKAFERN